MNLELLKEGLLPVDIKFSDKAKYYSAFDEYHENGLPDTMISLIAHYEIYELRRYIRIIEGKDQLQSDSER